MTDAADPPLDKHARLTKLIAACNDAQVAQRDVLLALTRSGDPTEDWEDFRPTLRLLLGYILERGFAALRLMTMRLDFDAEILLRTFHEGAAKLMLIALKSSANTGPGWGRSLTAKRLIVRGWLNPLCRKDAATVGMPSGFCSRGISSAVNRPWIGMNGGVWSRNGACRKS